MNPPGLAYHLHRPLSRDDPVWGDEPSVTPDPTLDCWRCDDAPAETDTGLCRGCHQHLTKGAA